MSEPSEHDIARPFTEVSGLTEEEEAILANSAQYQFLRQEIDNLNADFVKTYANMDKVERPSLYETDAVWRKAVAEEFDYLHGYLSRRLEACRNRVLAR